MNFNLLKEYILLAFENLMASKLRSFLTMLGIVIGISALIVMLILGESNKMVINEQLQNIGVNTISISKENMEDMSIPIDLNDHVLRGISFIRATSFEIITNENVNINSFLIDAQIMGISDEYFTIKSPKKILYGRTFLPIELKNNMRVCLIDHIAFNKYFKFDKARYIFIKGEKFKIIGSFKSDFYDPIYDMTFIYLPYKTIPNFEKCQWNLLLKLDDINNIDKKIIYLKKFLNFSIRNSDTLKILSANDMLNFSKNFSKKISIFIFGVSLILLTVGGIGIMNIMLISVVERTREIGIRRALGATINAIFYQFISETVILSFIAGIIGIVIGFIFGVMILKVIKLPFILPIKPIIFGIIISIGVGMFSGIYPSIKAARKNPIQALKYE